MPDRLKILMKLFKISNNDLALLLQVDVSLVSKWRTGVRNMTSNPEYVRKLVAYMINLDKKSGYKKCRELLSGEYQLENNCSENDMALLLFDWIRNPKMQSEKESILEEMLKSKTLTKIEQMYFWDGKKGRREAVKYFTRYAISCAPGAEIISYTTESNQWFHEDKGFLEEWKSMIHEFFDKGNIMKIIHPMNRNYHDIAASMAKWLPLHMSCEVKGYYLKKYDENDFIKMTILILRGKMVLFGIGTDRESESCHTWSLIDTSLVSKFEAVVMRYLKESVPLFRRYTLEFSEINRNFLDEMLALYEKGSACYFYNAFNYMFPISRGRREQILEKAGINKEKTAEIIMALETADTLRKACECYFLIDLEALHQWVKQERVGIDVLSLLGGQAVTLSGSDFADLLLEFLNEIRYQENFHIGILEPEYHKEFVDLSLCGGGRNIHTFITTYDIKHTAALEIQEFTVATALYHKMEMSWRAVPYLLKEKNYVISYIRKEIGEMCNR